MVMMESRPELSPWEIAARSFEPRPRRWAAPGDMAVELDSRMIQTPALRLMDQALVDLADGREQRLMIFAPPQEGKSERCSRFFPLWMLEQNPDLRVAIVSFDSDTARRWGWQLRLDIETFDGENNDVDLGLRLYERPAQGFWRIKDRYGSCFCTGVAGNLTGKPVDILCLDDPIKDLEQANSITYRERAWRFWQAVAIPRMGPHTKVCLVQTRWHCLLPDSDVLTADGVVDIKSLHPGSEVITSTGAQPVLAMGSRPHAGEIVRIQTYGYPRPLSLTPEHQVLTASGWRASGELRPMDWLVFPINRAERPIEEFRSLIPPPPVSTSKGSSRLTGERLPVTRDQLAADLEAGLTYQQIAEKYGRKQRCSAFDWARHYGLTRPADNVLRGDPVTDPDFWRVVGYWLAEGDVSSGRTGGKRNVIRWVFGHDEQHLVDDVREVLGRYGLRVGQRISTCRSSIVTGCSSAQFAALLERCGHGAHHKVLPEMFLRLPERFARELLRGYWIGDGCVTPENGTMNSGWARLASVSLSLLMGFYRLLPRLGIAPQIMRMGAKGESKYELRFPTCDAPWLNAHSRPIQQRSVKIDGDRLLVKVKRVSRDHYDGPVFDIKTPTRDFVANNFVVHNSDDLGGRLLESEGDKAEGGKWRVVSIPARCEDERTDLLGRKQGEYMLSARGRSEEDWREREKDAGAYAWAALFQQRPAPMEGGMFRAIWWRHWTPAGEHRLYLGGRVADLRDCWRFATVDLAASEKTSADWTVISAWARTLAGDLVLLDRKRARIDEAEHFAHARPLVERWQLDTVFVEKSQHGFSLVREATQNGVPISPLTAETDKITRALPASKWCSAGRVWLPAGVTWLDEWIGEHKGFPNASHDDQVDTLSYAVRAAITQWVPLVNRAQQATVQRAEPDADPFGGQQVEDWESRAF